MNAAASLITRLRAVGVSFRLEEDGLLVEAPAGVVTGGLREELVRRKAELIVALRSGTAQREYHQALDRGRQDVAALLATAYRRLKATNYIGLDGAGKSEIRTLAKAGDQSVHGVVL